MYTYLIANQYTSFEEQSYNDMISLFVHSPKGEGVGVGDESIEDDVEPVGIAVLLERLKLRILVACTCKILLC